MTYAQHWINQRTNRAVAERYGRSLVKPSAALTANTDQRRRLRDDPNADPHALAVSYQQRAMSLDAPIYNSDGDTDTTFVDTLTSSAPSPEDVFLAEESVRVRALLAARVVAAVPKAENRPIVAARLAGKTFLVAAQVRSVSRQRAKQITERALKRLPEIARQLGLDKGG